MIPSVSNLSLIRDGKIPSVVKDELETDFLSLNRGELLSDSNSQGPIPFLIRDGFCSFSY